MSHRLAFLAVVIVLPFAGCFGDYEVHAPPPAAKATSAKAASAPAPAPKPDAQARPAQPAPRTLSPSLSHPVQLSAGVALPQTLPDGTVMGFSVDYRFVQGQPDPSAAYVWVIERSQGAPSRQSVKLSPRGTLQAFVAEFRPEQGPFQAYLEDGHGNRISSTAPLR